MAKVESKRSLGKLEIKVIILIFVTLVKVEAPVVQLLEGDVTTENASGNSEQEAHHTG